MEFKGLTESEAKQLLEKYGFNEIEEKKEPVYVKFLKHFWNPIAWMIELAAIISLISGDYLDFIIILGLLILNGIIGFIEEYKADRIIELLKQKLSHKAKVLRDGSWKIIDAKFLVPGDIIKIKIGDIVPADAKILESNNLMLDESMLTGESLPVYKKEGDLVYTGTIVKKGEAICVVEKTGKNTFFGKTVKLVGGKGEYSDLQKKVVYIGTYLAKVAVFLIILMAIIEILRGKNILFILKYSLILLVSAIPAALPAVLTITLAIGARNLAKKQIIVSKLASIEELASVDVLCTDKTGTLTKNKLEIKDIISFNGFTKEDVLKYARLCSLDNDDPIDKLIIENYKKDLKFKVLSYLPFDPKIKRVESKVKLGDKEIIVSKGAPQVILKLCGLEGNQDYLDLVEEMAKQGYRTIMVAIKENGENWKLVGLISIYDPPREDAKEAIQKIKSYHIDPKMITGDHVSIAKTIAKMLGIGDKIYSIQELLKKYKGEELDKKIEEANGFAEVFPEHKYQIVDSLQKKGHFVAMTGDGVNDAPALKKANCGIAVSNATDAAKNAASVILLTPGISVIVDAIKEARKIFQRMKSYTIYRIAETIRILLFMTLCILLLKFYPLSAIMIILLVILNDIPILMISYDNVKELKYPARWEIKNLLTLSTILGISGVIGSFLLLFISIYYLHLPKEMVMSFVFIKLILAGHSTLFITRTEGKFYEPPYPSLRLLAAILLTDLIAILLVYFGILLPKLDGYYILLILLYVIVWMFIDDYLKLWYLKKVEKEHKDKLKI